MTSEQSSDGTERPNVRRPPVLATSEAVADVAEKLALDTVEHAASDPDEVADRLESVADKVRECSLQPESEQ